MALDISKLTLGEIATIEDLTGLPYDEALSEGKPKGTAMAALGLIAKRREQLAQGKLPDFKWNDALDLTFDDVAQLMGWNEDPAGEEDPKESSPVAPSKTTSTTSKGK